MNKQDALQKLTALEAETKALRAIIEAPEVPAVPKRWRPEDGERYSQVLNNGAVRTFINAGLTDQEYEHGNCFQTEAQAEIAAKAVGMTLKICAAAFAVDPDAGAFSALVRRYSLYRHDDGTLTPSGFVSNSNSNSKSGLIYSHTYAQANQMAAILNAEGV